MKIRDFNLKFSRVLILCLIVTVLTATLVYATTPQPFTINRGVYPGAPSFTVWEEDGVYYAKNQYGVIAYSGTDASQIIQAAIDASITIYSGISGIAGLIEFQAGIFNITTSITMHRGVCIKGAGAGGFYRYTTCFQINSDINAIVMEGSNMLEGITFYVPAAVASTYTKAVIYISPPAAYWISINNPVTVKDCQVWSESNFGYGIQLEGVEDRGMSDVTIENVNVLRFQYAFYLHNTAVNGWVNGNSILNCGAFLSPYGIMMNNTGNTNRMEGNRFSLFRYQGGADSERGYVVDDYYNTFIDMTIWDMPEGKYCVEITSGSYNTTIITGLHTSVLDSGTFTRMIGDTISPDIP